MLTRSAIVPQRHPIWSLSTWTIEQSWSLVKGSQHKVMGMYYDTNEA